MTLIILPVKNEESTIANTLFEIHAWASANLDEFKIIVINDGSTDRTPELCKEVDNDNIEVFDNLFDRGKGSALKTGYVLTRMVYTMKDDDDIIFLDGDGQIDPKEISTLYNIMELYNAECVIGNKRHKFSMTEYTMLRRVISQGYNFLIRTLFDLKFEDTQCGIKIFKKYVLEDIISKVSVKQYAFDLEMIVALRASRYRIADAPVTIKKQMNRGAIGFGSIFRTFFDTIMIWIKMKKRFYSPKSLI